MIKRSFISNFNKSTSRNLFKLLLDVCVRLEFELSAGVRPVHQEEPLLGVHLFDQYGCFLIVPRLQMKYTLVHSPDFTHADLLPRRGHFYSSCETVVSCLLWRRFVKSDKY